MSSAVGLILVGFVGPVILLVQVVLAVLVAVISFLIFAAIPASLPFVMEFVARRPTEQYVFCPACDEERANLGQNEHSCPICGEQLETRQVAPSAAEALRGPGGPAALLGALGRALQGGELPEALLDTLGLPPGANLASLVGAVGQQGGGELGGGAAAAGGAPPVSKAYWAGLPRLEVNERTTSSILQHVTLNLILPDGRKKQLDCTLGEFSPLVKKEGIQTQMVLADPILGDGDGFANAEQVAGKIVVFDRGGVTFADKALRAQAAGAVGAAICQTAAPWPYFMKDARGQAEEGGLEIPVVMVKRDDGEHLKQALRDQADISCSLEIEEEKECIICREEFAAGAAAVLRLPCAHAFHEGCLDAWLRGRNTCPVCRYELPTDDAEYERQRLAGSGHSVGGDTSTERNQSWMDWFG